MGMQKNRAEKWIAYLLGDLDSADAAAIEAEMKANPEEALEMTNTVEQIRAWSSESVPHVPLKLDDLGIDCQAHRRDRTRTSDTRFRWSPLQSCCWP